jgi:hypothetical protein
VGLFNRSPKVAVCEMCGKADIEGCGDAGNHVEEICGEVPSWLPSNLRAQAEGEYAWYCTQCDSYPAMKWPHHGGAYAGMMIHLGAAHHVGKFKGAAQSMSPRFDDQVGLARCSWGLMRVRLASRGVPGRCGWPRCGVGALAAAPQMWQPFTEGLQSLTSR